MALECFRPERLPPYYFTVFGNICKVVLFAFVFGAPKAAKERAEGRQADTKRVCMTMFRVVLLGLAVATAVSDVRKLADIFGEPDSFWLKIQCAAIELVTSSNLANFCGMMGVGELFAWRSIWKKLHDPDYEHRQSFGCMEKFITSLWPEGLGGEIGYVGLTYYGLLVFIYGPFYYVFIYLFTMSAAIVYCWFVLPLFGLIYYYLNPRLTQLMYAFASKKSQRTEPLVPQTDDSDERLTVLYRMVTYPAEVSTVVSREEKELVTTTMGLSYQEQFDYYVELGTPKWAFQHYLPWLTMHSMLLPCSTLMMCRLLSGEGYWDSFSKTMTERHLATYMAYVAGEAMGKITMLQVFF